MSDCSVCLNVGNGDFVSQEEWVGGEWREGSAPGNEDCGIRIWFSNKWNGTRSGLCVCMCVRVCEEQFDKKT